jgi:hypothetical protein
LSWRPFEKTCRTSAAAFEAPAKAAVVDRISDNGVLQLSPRDMNQDIASEDATVRHSDHSKSMFGTLKELHQNEQWAFFWDDSGFRVLSATRGRVCQDRPGD